ncbi:hypothetical protein C0J52_06493 [Blattella germanica]|nr:hypothetical protein C0J52_06493 [Blattella germanica]
MAASMCRGILICGYWIKAGQLYCYSSNSMTYSPIRNNSSALFTRAGVRFASQNLKHELVYSATNRTNMCVYRCIIGYGHKHTSHINIKSLQSRHCARRLDVVNCLRRWYTDDRGPPRRTLPSLMDFPEIVWPSVIKTLRNWILANLIITPYFDQEFRLPDFIFGSKQAVELVSGCLSKGELGALDNLMTSDALVEVKKNMSTFSLHQRQELAISKEDIYFSFPYQIGVMFSEDDRLKELTQQGITPPLNMGMLPEYRDKIFICNYRFIREFTKGVEDQWTVNVVNHFKPVDYTS